MNITSKDREILRELGRKTAEIAALPVHEETRKLWKALNSLKPVRPMVAIDQIPWHEMNVEDELTLKCEDDFCRSLEWKLRETLYRWKHMRADMVVEKFIDVNKVILGTSFGIKSQENTSALDPLNSVVGHYYLDQLQTEADIEKIRIPEVSLDEKATAMRETAALEIFDGILGVRMMGAVMIFSPWDRLVEWHGVENSLYDLADRPEFIHMLVSRLTDANMSLLDQLEEQGLLAYDIPLVHCTGAYTDELPAPSFNPQKPRACDTWTAGQAQIFATVSPAMHEEFDIQYASKWYARFGLGYYGCCEPLDSKIDIIRKLPHVRKISISPWADVKKAAEQIKGDYVLSNKPTPAYLATEVWNKDIVAENLQDTYNKCKENGTPLEFILKDISTLRYEPQRLWEWSEIALGIAKG